LRINFAIAFLLGAASTMLAVLVFRPAPPASADAITTPGYVAVAGNSQPGAKDVLWLVETKGDAPHLVLYQLDNGRLTIQAARSIKYDFMLDKFPVNGAPQSPTVEEVFQMTKEARDKARQPPGGGGSGTGGTIGTPPAPAGHPSGSGS
jgi:hypothetical protein